MGWAIAAHAWGYSGRATRSHDVCSKAALWTLPPAVPAPAVALFAILREVQRRDQRAAHAELAQAASTPIADARTVPDAGDVSDDPREALVVARRSVVTNEFIHAPPADIEFPAVGQQGFSNAVVNNETWRFFTAAPGMSGSRPVNRCAFATRPWPASSPALPCPSRCSCPPVILTVLLLVRRALKPLAHFERELHARQPDALSSLEVQGLPLELLPMATAMNALLERLSAALRSQEVFVSNAARELLTPLAALQIKFRFWSGPNPRSAETRDP